MFRYFLTCYKSNEESDKGITCSCTSMRHKYIRSVLILHFSGASEPQSRGYRTRVRWLHHWGDATTTKGKGQRLQDGPFVSTRQHSFDLPRNTARTTIHSEVCVRDMTGCVKETSHTHLWLQFSVCRAKQLHTEQLPSALYKHPRARMTSSGVLVKNKHPAITGEMTQLPELDTGLCFKRAC